MLSISSVVFVTKAILSSSACILLTFLFETFTFEISSVWVVFQQESSELVSLVERWTPS